MENMMSEQGVNDTVADQCMYGLVKPNADRTELVPAKKPTRFTSNSWHVLGELSTRCDKSHAHQPPTGGRAKKAQEYTYRLRRAICRGLVKRKMYDRSGRACTSAMQIKQLKSLITSVQQWQEADKKELDEKRTALEDHGSVFSLVLTYPPVGVLLGWLIGGRIISEDGSSGASCLHVAGGGVSAVGDAP